MEAVNVEKIWAMYSCHSYYSGGNRWGCRGFFENWSVGKDITFNKGRTDMSLSRLLWSLLGGLPPVAVSSFWKHFFQSPFWWNANFTSLFSTCLYIHFFFRSAVKQDITPRILALSFTFACCDIFLWPFPSSLPRCEISFNQLDRHFFFVFFVLIL